MDFLSNKIKSKFVNDINYDIPASFVISSYFKLDRITNIIKFYELLHDIYIASKIEAGVFEFTLSYIFFNNYHKNLTETIYDHKIEEIYKNLNSKSYLQNKTLMKAIQDKAIEPANVAFLSPDQIHPENWIDIINKLKFRTNVEKNIATTDIYKCKKCGEKKCHITELQVRSADEPVTRFVVCMVCYNTFTTN